MLVFIVLSHWIYAVFQTHFQSGTQTEISFRIFLNPALSINSCWRVNHVPAFIFTSDYFSLQHLFFPSDNLLSPASRSMYQHITRLAILFRFAHTKLKHANINHMLSAYDTNHISTKSDGFSGVSLLRIPLMVACADHPIRLHTRFFLHQLGNSFRLLNRVTIQSSKPYGDSENF